MNSLRLQCMRCVVVAGDVSQSTSSLQVRGVHWKGQRWPRPINEQQDYYHGANKVV